MTEMHQPTHEFERFLEWQIQTALRRRDRFTSPAVPGARRYLATAAVALVALLVGAGGVAASAEVQANAEKQALLRSLDSELRVAELQVQAAQQAADDAKRKAAVGVVDQADADKALREVERQRILLQQLRLEREETALSGKSALDDITAPRVNGRDFVTERLQLEERQAAIAADASKRELEAIRRRVEVGLAQAAESREVEARLAEVLTRMRALQDELHLRDQFLSGKLSDAAASRERYVVIAAAELQVAELRLSMAQQRYETAQKQVAVGMATEVDQLKAKIAVMEATADIERLREKIRQLKTGKD
jgi:hypothetical protein